MLPNFNPDAMNPIYPGAPQTENPFYQVTENDSSMADVSAATGVDLKTLVNLNDGSKTLPPKGSYIVTKPEGTAASQNAFNQRNQLNQPGQFNPAAGGLTTPYGQFGSAPVTGINGRMKDDADVWGHLNLPYVQNTIASAAATGSNVNIPINNAYLPQLGATAQSMQANGFTYNQSTGMWIPGHPQTASPGGDTTPNQGGPGGNSDFLNTKFMQQNMANNVSFYNQLRWDPSRGKYVRIGDLIRQGRLDEKTGKLTKPKHKGGARKVQVATGEGSRATNDTVLGLHLGSG